jgi:hypothetical protein
LPGKEVDLIQHDRDVLALLLETGPAPLELRQELLELLALVPRHVVQLEQLADLRQREAQASLSRTRSRLVNTRALPSRFGLIKPWSS